MNPSIALLFDTSVDLQITVIWHHAYHVQN